MAVKVLERSGRAVTEYCKLLNWEPNLILQVGIGYHCKEASVMRNYWPNTPIIGYDPTPGLTKSLGGNYPGEIINYAISHTPSIQKFYIKNKHGDGNSLFQHTNRESPSVDVTVRTLDSVGPIKNNTLLWLDCEGSEHNVLLGATSRLKTCIDVINVEMTHNPLKCGGSESWGRPIDTHNLLVKLGFFKAWTHTHRCSAGQYDAIYVSKRLFKPEYCCCTYETERYNKEISQR